MYLFLTILVVFASILMLLIVLVQNSKGGGLASGFSSNNQYMGVRKTTDFLEKATWTLAASICILSMASSAFMPHEKYNNQPEVKVEQTTTIPTNDIKAPNVGD